MKIVWRTCLIIYTSLYVSIGQAQKKDKPNVIIMFIDDLGYGDLSSYGNTQIQTTNIDALANQGTRFMQFYVNSPVCSPSRVAMMTGQYPIQHQLHLFG